MQLSRSALAKGCSKQQQVVVVTPIAAQAAQCCSFCVISACRSCHPSCSCHAGIMHTHGRVCMHRCRPLLRKAGEIIVYNIYFTTTAVLNLLLNLVLYLPWRRPALSHATPPARINSRDLLNLVMQ